jgi:hypothetical protein
MKTASLKKAIFFFSLIFTALNANKPLMEDSIAIPVTNICDLSQIYNSEYQYSLPRKFLEDFLSGKAFDHQEFYTAEESTKLSDDISEIWKNILVITPDKENLAIITAGAPGAGKTIKLRQDAEGKNIAYICPDDVCLKNQTRTYLEDVANSDGSIAARKAAYDKWRPGSNAATHLILANLIREKYAFYFGTTSSGPATSKFFEFLKNQGYRIRLIHVSAPDDVRWGSIQERDQTFVQTTEQDIREKGQLLPQRINDTFLKYADEIEFYYRNEIKADAVLAAKWIRNEKGSEEVGTLEILNPGAYERIKTIHNEAIKSLARPDLEWEATVETSSKIVNSF